MRSFEVVSELEKRRNVGARCEPILFRGSKKLLLQSIKEAAPTVATASLPRRHWLFLSKLFSTPVSFDFLRWKKQFRQKKKTRVAVTLHRKGGWLEVCAHASIKVTCSRLLLSEELYACAPIVVAERNVAKKKEKKLFHKQN